MTYITTRALRDYYNPTEARSRITLLDRLAGSSFMKLVWWQGEHREIGSNLRHVDIDNAIEALRNYLVAHQHSKIYTVQRSLPTKRELLDVLKILKDK